jgi:hypothetical protein
MYYRIADFNGADTLFNRSCSALWNEVDECLTALKLHVKQSDEAGRQGNLIFNPVGTNQELKDCLGEHDWQYLQLPEAYSFFGLGIDFDKQGAWIEAQFSNYPFLLNNILRAEVLYRDKVSPRGNHRFRGMIVITKAKHFPSSNSTLHFEQAVDHLNGLNRHKLFSVPTRLVGLDVEGDSTQAVLTTYSSPRYSRTVTSARTVRISVERSTRGGSSKFHLLR